MERGREESRTAGERVVEKEQERAQNGSPLPASNPLHNMILHHHSRASQSKKATREGSHNKKKQRVDTTMECGALAMGQRQTSRTIIAALFYQLSSSSNGSYA